MAKLTVALATFNEEKNIRRCLASIQLIADEIVIVDGTSTDKTVEIAKEFGAKIKITKNEKIFHINKQKALEMASGDWILQLDADEVISPALAKEIVLIMSMTDEEIEDHEEKETIKTKIIPSPSSLVGRTRRSNWHRHG